MLIARAAKPQKMLTLNFVFIARTFKVYVATPRTGARKNNFSRSHNGNLNATGTDWTGSATVEVTKSSTNQDAFNTFVAIMQHFCHLCNTKKARKSEKNN